MTSDLSSASWSPSAVDVTAVGTSRCASNTYAPVIVSGQGKAHFGNVYNTCDNSSIGKLPEVSAAAFDSYEDEQKPRCLEGTRVSILRDIYEWAGNPAGNTIFWLNGMAGTGKSTIARTLCESLYNRNRLGASFFFQRGAHERSNGRKFFATIASQLARSFPEIDSCIASILRAQPDLCDKSLKAQFENLILKPLRDTSVSDNSAATSTARDLIVCVDALDECAVEYDIETILSLLSQAQYTAQARLRWFITSRPALPIRLGIEEIAQTDRTVFYLHKIPDDTLSHDLLTYFQNELARIGKQYRKQELTCEIISNWPDRRDVDSLVRLAHPLFISAATICRIVGGLGGNPMRRLKHIMDTWGPNGSLGLSGLYLPILEYLITDHVKYPQITTQSDFHELLGPLVVLEGSLSTRSLAHLLQIEHYDVRSRLSRLHAVITVPDDLDAPIKFFHASFPDFLLDPQNQDKSHFWINRNTAHEMLSIKCFKLLSEPGVLKKDMCDRRNYSVRRDEVLAHDIVKHIPHHVMYASRYWAHHLEHSVTQIPAGEVLRFLEKKFLFLMETLAWCGASDTMSRQLHVLKRTFSKIHNETLFNLLGNARDLFFERQAYIIDAVPLQVYCASPLFHSHTSVARETFEIHMPDRLKAVSELVKPAQSHGVTMMFSPDGARLVLASIVRTGYLGVIDTLTGELVWETWLNGNFLSFNLSGDGEYLASATINGDLRLFETLTGMELWQGNSGRADISSIACSSTRQILTAGKAGAIHLWDTTGSQQPQKLAIGLQWSEVTALSTDARYAAASNSPSVKVWDTLTSHEIYALQGICATALSFSLNGDTIAIGAQRRILLKNLTIDGAAIELTTPFKPSFLWFSGDDTHLRTGWGTVQLRSTPNIEYGTPLRGLAYDPKIVGYYMSQESYDLFLGWQRRIEWCCAQPEWLEHAGEKLVFLRGTSDSGGAIWAIWDNILVRKRRDSFQFLKLPSSGELLPL